MKRAGSLTLIINTYNQPDYLGRVLVAVSRQTRKPDEVLLADDGSTDETRTVFTRWAAAQSFPTGHVWQKNEGFRRSRILNLAIARARGDYLVFLDGDTVPHPGFVLDHHALDVGEFFVQGHRALVGQRAAEWFGCGEFFADRLRALCLGQLSGWKHAFHWPLPLRRVRQDLTGIRGCNLGIRRDHLIRVNGYNEAFVGWGREDSDLAQRLMNSGARRLDVRGWALCFHLWHPPASRGHLEANDRLLAETQREGVIRCEHGLDQHHPPDTA